MFAYFPAVLPTISEYPISERSSFSGKALVKLRGALISPFDSVNAANVFS